MSVQSTRHSLLMRIKNRDDQRAWSEFDSIYRPLLHQFARRMGLDGHASDDVVQHCMETIHRHIGDFEYDPDRGRFKSWLRTLVNNRVRTLKGRNREQQPGTGDFNRIEQGEPSPEEIFERAWMTTHARHCLQEIRPELDDRTYRVYVMCVVEEKPIKEICAILGINANTVYQIRFRVTQKIRAKMDELLGPENRP